MQAVKFKQSNFTLGAGNNPDTNDMPACRAVSESGQRFIIGKFKMSELERKQFLETGELWICIMGGGWPPMLPTAHNPFDELNFKPVTPIRGLPDIEYRDQINDMLKEIFHNPNMTDEQWLDMIEQMAETYPFEQIPRDINKAIESNPKVLKEEIVLSVLHHYKECIIEALKERFNPQHLKTEEYVEPGNKD